MVQEGPTIEFRRREKVRFASNQGQFHWTCTYSAVLNMEKLWGYFQLILTMSRAHIENSCVLTTLLSHHTSQVHTLRSPPLVQIPFVQ